MAKKNQKLKQENITVKHKKNWPHPPLINTEGWDTSELSSTQTWQLLKILESVSFVQPNLELVVEYLWEKTTQ